MSTYKQLAEKQKELNEHLEKLLRSTNYEVILGNSKWMRLKDEIKQIEETIEKKEQYPLKEHEHWYQDGVCVDCGDIYALSHKKS